MEKAFEVRTNAGGTQPYLTHCVVQALMAEVRHQALQEDTNMLDENALREIFEDFDVNKETTPVPVVLALCVGQLIERSHTG